MSDFGCFPQREQKREYGNENECKRCLTVHQSLATSRDVQRKYQRAREGFNTLKTVTDAVPGYGCPDD